MASAGPNSPSAATNTNRGTNPSWLNPANATTSDDTNTSVTIADALPSDYLDVTGFGFSLPANAVIDGVVVEVECRENNNSANIFDETAQLLVASSPVGVDRLNGTEWATADTYRSHGGAADLWGATLTAADVNDSGFGFRLAVSGAISGVGRVDHIRTTVYYTEAGVPRSTVVVQQAVTRAAVL